MNEPDYSLGCRLPSDTWVALNRTEVFSHPELMRYVSPFPPTELMQSVSGLVSQSDFASHGADFYVALSKDSPKPLSEFTSILDFGCGVGRLSRLFKGHPGRIAGCDIDHRHVSWMQGAIDFMDAKLSSVTPPIPYVNDEFECVISISIFTHLNEKSQDEFLAELARVCQPNGTLMLTIHGETALKRAIEEPVIRNMIAVDDVRFEQAQKEFADGRHAFILQQGHLTTTSGSTGKVIEEPFEYGITFIPASYIESHWSKWFSIEKHVPGSLHNFQDLLVLTPKK